MLPPPSQTDNRRLDHAQVPDRHVQPSKAHANVRHQANQEVCRRNGHEKTLLPQFLFTTLVLVLWLVRAGATNQYMEN